MNDCLQNKSCTIIRHQLCRGSSAGKIFTTHDRQADQTASLYPLSIFRQRQDILHLPLGSSFSVATLPENTPTQIPSLRHRADQKIAPGSRNLPKARSARRDLLSVQWPGKQWSVFCCPDQRRPAHRTQGINVGISLSIKKPPAWVRFSDLGRGFT